MLALYHKLARLQCLFVTIAAGPLHIAVKMAVGARLCRAYITEL